MNRLTVRLRAAMLLLAVLLLAVVSAVVLWNDGKAIANVRNDYYYGQLTPEGKRFYDAIGAMEESGLLKTGRGEYDLVANGILTDAQLRSYSVNSEVMIAFGAARDAYRMDHPEVFYIDFDYLSVSVGMKNGSYVASLGTGRADHYYIADGFTSESEVNAAIAALDGKVSAIVSQADKKEGSVEKIRSVNAQLVQATEYSFCATADENGTTYEEGAAWIRNPYGALVNGKAVCEGYARAFKMAMDRLGIECVLVQGVAQAEANGGYEPHMWNYVRIDGGWYAVDVTWNDTAGNAEDYFLRGNAVMKLDHLPDGVLSECSYRFDYPALAAYDYGVTVDPNGISIRGEYIDGSSEGSKILHFTVSYAGKNATRLKEEDGLYLIYRYRYEQSGSMEWGNWIYYWDDEKSDGTSSETIINSYYQYIQFAVIDYAPDGQFDQYREENISDQHIGQFSEPFVNYAYGTYFAPPYVKQITPSNQSFIGVGQSYEVTVTYTENLKIAEAGKAYGIVFASQHSDISKYAKVENVEWSSAQPDALKFTFTPSQMFQHRYETYSFFVVNLVGEESGKEPNSFSFTTEQQSVACSKIYGDGRLYIKSYGEPSLVSAGDLSMTGWQTADGKYVSENQRSQLALIVTRPEEGGDMVENATSEYGDQAVLASETYELELDLCGQIVKIPDGSSMQLAFGFPAGYGPGDVGVTFKVYHFKRGADGAIDYGKTEELECVVTEYGLIVNVSDFSPFAVVALRKSEVSDAGKGIYARTVGYGGSVDGDGIRILNGGEVTYRFQCEEGYRVDRVLLNGEEQAIADDSLTLRYEDLDENNLLTVSFVADRIASREQEEGITPVYPAIKVEGITASAADVGKGDDGGTLAGIVAVCAVAVVCLVAAAAVVVAKKRRT